MKASDINQLLPNVFQQAARGNPLLQSIYDVMEAMHAPSEQALEELDATLNPYRTRDEFIAMLAQWVDVDWVFDGGTIAQQCNTVSSELIPPGLGRVRELIASAANLSKWRGTAKGLVQFLETATGVKGFIVREQVIGPNGRPKPFHLHIQAPVAVLGYKTLVTRIIEAEKPAYVTYELEMEVVPIEEEHEKNSQD